MSLFACAQAAAQAAALLDSGAAQRPCPPCGVLVSVLCRGGHQALGVRCSEARPQSCGRLCGRRLPCGSHFESGVHSCARECHAATGDGAHQASCHRRTWFKTPHRHGTARGHVWTSSTTQVSVMHRRRTRRQHKRTRALAVGKADFLHAHLSSAWLHVCDQAARRVRHARIVSWTAAVSGPAVTRATSGVTPAPVRPASSRPCCRATAGSRRSRWHVMRAARCVYLTTQRMALRVRRSD